MGLARKLRVVGVAKPCSGPAPIDTSPQAYYAKSIPALAWFLRCNKTSICNYLNAGAPTKTKAGFNVQEWFQWMFDRQAESLKRPEDESAAEAERRLKIAKAGREELKLGHDKHNLVDASEAKRGREDIIRWFLAKLEQLGPTMQSKLAPAAGMKLARKARKAADDYVRRMRKEAGSG